jgi:uncharacterized protein with von Willebrand factor type A (vWA) domain
MSFPRALKPFVDFPALLRANGFPGSPDQTMAFIEAVGLLGPRDMADIYRAATATLAPPYERRPEFDALFRFLFHGHSLASAQDALEPDDDMRVQEDRGGTTEPPESDEQNFSGEQAASVELLTARAFAPGDEAEVLRRFRRHAPAALPRRQSQRREAAGRGDALNMRRAMRDAVKRDGEMLSLPRLRRKLAQRRILLLIDVSGSMKAHTDGSLRFAHALARVSDRIETFTVGTRLTRITRAMRLVNRDQALAAAAATVADWDGGTRIGDALHAFLSVPRFASFARGALVVIVSDGLERGDHTAMTRSVETLSRLAWRIVWLTPLAADAGFAPRTAAMQSILPFVDAIGDGSSLERLCHSVLSLKQGRAA